MKFLFFLKLKKMNKLILEVAYEEYEETKTKFKNDIVRFSKHNPNSKIKDVLFELWEQVQPSNINSLYKKSEELIKSEFRIGMNNSGNSILKISAILLGTGLIMSVVQQRFFKIPPRKYDSNAREISNNIHDLPGMIVFGSFFIFLFGLCVKFDVHF